MRKTFKGGAAALAAVLLAASLLPIGLMGCAPDEDEDAGVLAPTPEKYKEMVSFAGEAVTGSGLDGAFPSARTSVTIPAFSIAKYETTWQLWKEVYDWAREHGYTIANSGVEGHGTKDGTGLFPPSQERITRPVANISWRDAIIWCNAYSEMSGKMPVYYTDNFYTRVLKSTSGTGTTAADTVAMRFNADGFRLPTEAEWEYAARGGDQTDTVNWNYRYAGSSTVGAVAWYKDNSYTAGKYDTNYGIHPVGTKAANSKGLFDMSGNVYEWCWDWLGTINAGTPVEGPVDGSVGSYRRIFRGGGWLYREDYCGVSYRLYDPPNYSTEYFGFRVARSR